MLILRYLVARVSPHSFSPNCYFKSPKIIVYLYDYFLMSHTFQEMTKFLQHLDAESLTTLGKEGQLQSFRYLYVIAGDVVYLPPGTIVCEKAMGTNSTGIRVVSMLHSEAHLAHLSFMASVYPTCFDSEFQHLFLYFVLAHFSYVGTVGGYFFLPFQVPVAW